MLLISVFMAYQVFMFCQKAPYAIVLLHFLHADNRLSSVVKPVSWMERYSSPFTSGTIRKLPLIKAQTPLKTENK